MFFPSTQTPHFVMCTIEAVVVFLNQSVERLLTSEVREV